MGYYGTASPAVILRNVFENPAWYTSYTPYQAEISQGRLEALLNFQTAVVSMTGMEVSNCSLLDEATATAEAMAMMFALRSREAVREGRNVLFVDENIFPQTLDVLLTRSEPFGIEIVSDRFDCYEFTGSEFGAIVQYPAADGEVRDYDDFAAAAHSRGVLVTAVADMLSLALLKAPGEWGADIVTGSTQRFGIPMGFGGPHAAYLGHEGRFQAKYARPDHRRFGRSARQQSAAHGASDARAAHQARAGHVEYLYGSGAAGYDGRLLRRLSRSRGHPSDRPACPQSCRRRGRYARKTGLRAENQKLLRYDRGGCRCGASARGRARPPAELLLSRRGPRAAVVRRAFDACRGECRDRRVRRGGGQEELRRSRRSGSRTVFRSGCAARRPI